MKRLLSVAAGIAAVAAPVVVVVSREASAVEDPPEAHYQLLEAESMAPLLESYAGVTAGTATVSVGRRQSNTGGLSFSGQAAMLFDNHNADGSRMTLPFEVEAPDSYLVSASLVKGPTYGVVQVSIDGRPLGAPVDGYAAALARPAAVALGGLELSKGEHTVALTVTGKNAAATDYLAALDFLELDSEAAPAPEPTAVADVPVGGVVDPTLALTVGAPVSFGSFTPGMDKTYESSTTANVISTAGDAALSVSEPGRLTNGTFTLAQPLQVTGVPKTWDAPVSNGAVTIGFKQAIGAGEALRTGSYSKTLTFTLSTSHP